MNKLPDRVCAQSVRFVGEQTGPTETVLKSRLAQQMASGALVLSAFLARATFGTDPRAVSVVLAIRTRSGLEEHALLPDVQKVFGAIFGPHEHLDILFIREDQETEIRKVCGAFYPATVNAAAVH